MRACSAGPDNFRMLKKAKKFWKMTSQLNQKSDNSVLGGTGDKSIPADGTGTLVLIELELQVDHCRRDPS